VLFSGAVIQPGHDRLDLFIRHPLTICTFPKIRPYQPVGVFIDPTLPRTIRIGKEKVRLKSLGYLVGGGQTLSRYPISPLAKRRQKISGRTGHLIRFFAQNALELVIRAVALFPLLMSMPQVWVQAATVGRVFVNMPIDGDGFMAHR